VKNLLLLFSSILFLSACSAEQQYIATPCECPKVTYTKTQIEDLNVSIWKEKGGNTSYISMEESDFSKLYDAYQTLKTQYNILLHNIESFNSMIDNINSKDINASK
jgi:outer membrane biogenesis lipoprotein LolB